MKKSITLLFISILFISCQENKRYTQQSPEIDTYKKAIEAYNKMDWETMAGFYADSAKIIYNKLEKEAITLPQLIELNKKDAQDFTSWGFTDKDSEYEMVVTDKGETWVNYWGVWKGDFKPTNKTYIIPAHMTAQFVNGKIVKEFGYWDNSEFYKDLSVTENTQETTTE